jgi:hypothetical protein
VWSFYEYDYVMRLTDPDSVAVRFPRYGSPRWFVSGFESGAEELGATAVVADERYGSGRVVVFAGEPNFRAFTDGTQRILWNAVYGPDPRARVAVGSGAERAAAAAAARRLVEYDGRLVVTVEAGVQRAAARAFGRAGLAPKAMRVAPGRLRYLVPLGSAEESRYARELVVDLSRLGEAVVAVRVP